MGITYRSAKLPANPIGLYWPYWNPGTRLINMPSQFNMFIYFACTGSGGGQSATGTVVYNAVSGIPIATVAEDFATVRAQGKRVLLSIGGAGAQVYVNSLTNANNFIQSIKDINVSLGGSGTTAAFDGIDWNNYEGVVDVNFRQWMTYAGQQLKAYYGSDFIISSPPAGYSLSGPGPNVTADRLLLAEMYAGNALDWFCPQFYDPSDLNTLANKRLGLDVYNTAVTVNGQSVQIPRNHIGVGMGLNYSGAALSAYETAADAAADYTQLVSDGRTPKGGFLWAASLGTYNAFATTVAPVMNNNAGDPPPAFEVDTVTSVHFADGDNTTAQLTAPSGKTTSNFTTGKMSEGINPVPSIDIGEDGYTELEWCLQATAEATNGEVFQFRVTYNGTPLDGYVTYPQWTVGTPSNPPDTSPPGNNYLTFYGDGGYIEIPDDNAYSVPTTGELTISAWMRPDTLLFKDPESGSGGVEGSYVMWLGKGGYHVSNTLEWGFRMYSNDGSRPNRISFYVFNLDGGLGVGSYFQDVINTGEWIHVLAKVDSTYTYIYKNGVLRDQDEYPSFPITPENGTEAVRIGTMTKTSYWQGGIKDVCIWNRALTNAEVAQVAVGTIPGSGLVGRWKLDEGTGTTVADSAGSNDGTITLAGGDPTWTLTSTEQTVTTSVQGLATITGLASITI